MGDEADKQTGEFIRAEAHIFALFRDAMFAEGFTREETIDLLVAFGQAESQQVKNLRFDPPVLVPAHLPHLSHNLVSVPDRYSRTCTACGMSEFDAKTTEPCSASMTPVIEVSGHDEAPDPPEPDIEDELEEEATNHANETGHGVDNGS